MFLIKEMIGLCSPTLKEEMSGKPNKKTKLAP